MNAVLTIPEMFTLEQRAFAEGVEPWDLMQEVGRQMARAIRQRYPEPGFCRVFAGRGNNGGDAWVVARLLDEAGWNVEVECPFSVGEMSPLAKRTVEAWSDRRPSSHSEIVQIEPPSGRRPLVVVDGLLGIGVEGEMRSPIREAILQIRQLRDEGATVFSLDLPSGLGTDLCVVADHTLAVGFAKTVLLDDAATQFVGRVSVLPLAELSSRYTGTGAGMISTAAALRPLVPPRSFEFHKGQGGRVVLVAGSRGMAGAAVLAALGALRGGAGTVRLVCPPQVFPTLAPMLPPEVMVRPWDQLPQGFFDQLDVLAIGPGLDPEWGDFVWPLIRNARMPLILDAGALTLLARTIGSLSELNAPVLLTPHPGEMERLFPRGQRSRAEWAQDFLTSHANEKVTLLLKGSRSLVATAGQPISYNSTGHPGMASGGMGDTLTGVCAALVAQKLSLYNAARVASWVCGHAAELTLEGEGESQESLLASDVARCLGRAFADLRAGVY
ncbi:MAG TPA: NAD(P)H-hydrate dehydratase [Chthoniobacterales bacterium]|jgi:NAD(P)H-hydrate epimerase